MMADMRRVTISVPNNLDIMILNLRKQDRFARCSYAEIVRQLLLAGLNAEILRTKEKAKAAPEDGG